MTIFTSNINNMNRSKKLDLTIKELSKKSKEELTSIIEEETSKSISENKRNWKAILSTSLRWEAACMLTSKVSSKKEVKKD